MSAEPGVQTQASTDQRPGLGAALGLVIGLVIALPIFFVATFFSFMTKDITIFLLGVFLGLMPALVLGIVLFFLLWNRRGTGGETTRWKRHPG